MVVLAMASPPKNDAMAKKYCFKATGIVRVIRTGRPVSSVVAYDKTPDVGATVESICQERAALDDGLEVGSVQMTLYDECPAECEITIIEFPEEYAA